MLAKTKPAAAIAVVVWVRICPAIETEFKISLHPRNPRLPVARQPDQRCSLRHAIHGMQRDAVARVLTDIDAEAAITHARRIGGRRISMVSWPARSTR